MKLKNDQKSLLNKRKKINLKIIIIIRNMGVRGILNINRQ